MLLLGRRPKQGCYSVLITVVTASAVVVLVGIGRVNDRVFFSAKQLFHMRFTHDFDFLRFYCANVMWFCLDY